jgi:hypothetical protein
MSSFPEFKKNKRIKDVWDNKKAQSGWIRTLNRAFTKKLNSWDYPWLYTFWSNSGLCVLPNTNLVKNIGFGNEATHTKSSNKNMSSLETDSINEIKHPTFILQDKEADQYTYDHIFSTSLLSKIINVIKNL